jgi:anti-anti-sigma regulatory factor
MQPVKLSCGEALDVRSVSVRRQEWMDLLQGEGGVSMDVGGLKVLDTAGVQLLVSCERQCREQGRAFELRGESPALTDSLALLGLTGWGQ